MSELQRSIAGGNTVRIYKSLDLFWARLAVHIRAEHLVIFPAVLDLVKNKPASRSDISATLKDLRLDHDFFIKELARAVKAMRLVPDFGNESETLEIVSRLVAGVASRLEKHNRIEEEVIYPLTGDLSANDKTARSISDRTQAELKNMPVRFRRAE